MQVYKLFAIYRCSNLCVLFLPPQPKWEPYTPEYGGYIDVSFSYSADLWPWSGYLAISITASKEAASWEGVAKGQVTVVIESPPEVS